MDVKSAASHILDKTTNNQQPTTNTYKPVATEITLSVATIVGRCQPTSIQDEKAGRSEIRISRQGNKPCLCHLRMSKNQRGRLGQWKVGWLQWVMAKNQK